MSNSIDSITQQYLQAAAKLGESSAKDKSGDTKNVSATPETDTVELTQSARLLRTLSDAIAQVGENNQPKVDAVRSRIESGQYEIAADRVAYKMLMMDQSLPTEN